MNEDIIKGNWKQVKGELQKQWGKLTDDMVDQAEGSRSKLVGIIQEQYGIERHEAEQRIEEVEKKVA